MTAHEIRTYASRFAQQAEESLRASIYLLEGEESEKAERDSRRQLKAYYSCLRIADRTR